MTEGLRPLIFLLTYGLFDVLLMASLAGLCLLGHAAWGRRAERSRQALIGDLGRCLLLGVADVLGTFIILAVLGRNAPPLARLSGVVLIPALAWCFLVGVTGFLTLVGQRIMESAERVSTPVTAALVGAVTVCAAALLPWVGWAMLVLCLLAAIGAGAMGAWRNP